MKDLVSYTKMQSWHNGTRKQNIKACSDEKLEMYYKICCEKGYVLEANKLYRESVMRDLDFDPIEFIEEPDLKPEQLCQYIEEHMNEIGDDGGDLFKFDEYQERGLVGYSWGMSNIHEEEIYDCVIDFRARTVKFNFSIVSSFDDMREVIENINNELFGC